MNKPKAIFNWSGGKDSSLCLHRVLQSKVYDISCLLTSVNEQYQRISMHGVRVELLEQQAASIGLPLKKLMVPEMPTMEDYDRLIHQAIIEEKEKGVTASIFGDIFLEDLKKYREDQLAKANLKGIFPLWKISTQTLINEFIDLGFKAIIVCVNAKYLDQSFVGRLIDANFLKDLPNNVDPCGENGEYHSFVFDGPIFRKPIDFRTGEVVYRTYLPSKKSDGNKYDCENADSPFNTGFWYIDLISDNQEQ